MATGQKPLRIVVIDDEPFNLALYERALRGIAEVVTASNGIDALHALEAASVDVVVTDQRMPGMSGLEVAREVRARRPGLWIVIVTGDPEDGAVIEALEARLVDRIVGKPFSLASLRAAVTAR